MALQAFDLIDNPLTRALASPRQVDDYLAWINPLWVANDTRARVVGVSHHNEDVVSLQLQPGRGWQGHCAGQHVMLGVDIDGTRYQRTFSISSAAGQKTSDFIEITIKRNGNGRVSNYLVDDIKNGDLVWLGVAEGDFVLPEQLPQRFLMIAAGSGITPVMSMLRQLCRDGYRGEIVLLNFTKSEHSLIFSYELKLLEHKMDGLRVVHFFTQEGDSRCNTKLLQRELDLPQDLPVFLCGPEAMMAASFDALKSIGLTDIHQERFKLAATVSSGDGLVQFQKSGVTAAGDSAGSLLEVAEKAGLAPTYGCRMGICHSCTCNVTGDIKDVRNGEVRRVEGEGVQICVNAAAGSVKVDV